MDRVWPVSELARLVGGQVIGDGSKGVRTCSGVQQAHVNAITFAQGDAWRGVAAASDAGAVVVDAPLDGAQMPQIVVEDPNLAFAEIVEHMQRGQAIEPGVHHTASIHKDAQVHDQASVGPNVTVEKGARVGAGTRLDAGVIVEEGARVGERCHIRSNVIVAHHCVIGDEVIIHSNTVVGSDGFGYATTKDGRHIKVPQIGIVVIEDRVEIGSCVCIDRARMDETRVGEGSKIDNLVQVAHNVQIGPNCLIVAQAGIAGSAELGRNVVLGGNAGVTGHVKIGDGAQISAFSGVSKNLPGGQGYMGVPAIPIREGKRVRLMQLKLPSIVQRLKALEAALAKLQADGGESET